MIKYFVNDSPRVLFVVLFFFCFLVRTSRSVAYPPLPLLPPYSFFVHICMGQRHLIDYAGCPHAGRILFMPKPIACKGRNFNQAVIKWNKTILILGWWRKGMAQKDSCYWSSFTLTGCVSDPRKKGRQKKPRSRRSTDVLEGQPVFGLNCARFGFIQKKEIASSQSEK